MEPVEDTRRTRLRMLADEHGGLANLVERLGYSRKETSGLSRILNGNLRHDRAGEPYVMGSLMARTIEEKTEKPRGWMDTPPEYIELHNNPRIAHVIRTMERMDGWQQERTLRIVDNLSLPAPDQTLGPQPAAPASTPPSDPDDAKAALDKLREDSKKKKAPRRRQGGMPPQRKGGDNAA